MQFKDCATQQEVIVLAQRQNPARKVTTVYGWGHIPTLNRLHAERWENHRAYGTGEGDLTTGNLLFFSRELAVAVTENSIYVLVGNEKTYVG